MVYITHVRMSAPGNRHEHITNVQWHQPATGKSDSSTVAHMVEWIDKGNQAKVTDGRNTVDVLVVRATPPHLRTVADGSYTDNLLSLPRF